VEGVDDDEDHLLEECAKYYSMVNKPEQHQFDEAVLLSDYFK
jgi:hypothetical protein